MYVASLNYPNLIEHLHTNPSQEYESNKFERFLIMKRMLPLAILVMVAACTSIEEGGYSPWIDRQSEVISQPLGSNDQRTARIKLHALNGGGVGYEIYLSGRHIAWLRKVESIELAVTPGQYDFCVGWIATCTQLRPTNLVLQDGETACFSYRYPRDIGQTEVLKPIDCAEYQALTEGVNLLVVE